MNERIVAELHRLRGQNEEVLRACRAGLATDPPFFQALLDIHESFARVIQHRLRRFEPPAPKKEKARRGFAVMAPELQREIASRGGRKAQALAKGHQFTPEERRLGGLTSGRIISQDTAHMSRIGRQGGLVRRHRGGQDR